MSIVEDLNTARAEALKYISLAEAVTELSQQAVVSEKDAAQWLILKGADIEITAYLFDPVSYKITELALQKNHGDEFNYDSVRNYLARMVKPDPGHFIGVTFERIMNGGRMPFATWKRKDFTAFLSANGHSVMEPETALIAAIATEPDIQDISSRMDQRQKIILANIADSGWEPQEIPNNGKATLRNRLCEGDRTLFTPATFDKAWGQLSATGTISIVNKQRYQTRDAAEDERDR